MQSFFDNLRLAFGAFVAHPLRTLLTLLGIVIGVATVMVMMALLTGLQDKVAKDFSQLGANVFRIDKWPQGFNFGGGGVDWNRIAKRPALTVNDMEAVRDHSPSVLRAAAVSWQPAQRVKTATTQSLPNIFIVGSTADYPDTSNIVIRDGRYFTESDDMEARNVAVIGPDVADRLFPSTTPIGQEVRVKDRPFTVIGLMERRGKFMGMFNLDNQVAIPMSTFLNLYGRKRTVSVSVEARDSESVKKAIEEATRVMRKRRNVEPTADNDFEIGTNESMAKSFNQMSAVVTAATFGVCLISLVVGGIGILNIMLVSVTERTREIGIRKALGATRRRILGQFALEAALLGLFGGIIGIILGYALAMLARWSMGLYAHVPLWAVVVSILMSSGVGFIFGVYPAGRAARLDPIDAMRAE